MKYLMQRHHVGSTRLSLIQRDKLKLAKMVPNIIDRWNGYAVIDTVKVMISHVAGEMNLFPYFRQRR